MSALYNSAVMYGKFLPVAAVSMEPRGIAGAPCIYVVNVYDSLSGVSVVIFCPRVGRTVSN